MPNRSVNIQKRISRRDFLKITAIAGLTVGLGASLGRKVLSMDSLQKFVETYYLMGTVVNFTIVTPDVVLAKDAIRQTVAEMERLINIFDYRHPDNTLARLNHDGSLPNAPVELVDVINQSLKLSALSYGAFDITVLPILEAYRNGQFETGHLINLIGYRNVILDGSCIRFAHSGMSITLDGIAKGRVVDAGVTVLKSLGFENVIVEAGGDMMTSSSDLKGEGWSVAINNPRPSPGTEYIATFTVKNKAVTTSGDYLNYFSPDHSRYHIIDPRAGRSPLELASATVVASTAAEADALSTTLMVLGVRDGLELVHSLTNVEALLVTRDMKVHSSRGFPN